MLSKIQSNDNDLNALLIKNHDEEIISPTDYYTNSPSSLGLAGNVGGAGGKSLGGEIGMVLVVDEAGISPTGATGLGGRVAGLGGRVVVPTAVLTLVGLGAGAGALVESSESIFGFFAAGSSASSTNLRLGLTFGSGTASTPLAWWISA